MQRFMGLMPLDEIKKEKAFRVGKDQWRVLIQAGENGWTIVFDDYSTRYQNVADTTENNFETALKVLKEIFTDVNEIESWYAINDAVKEC